MGVDTTSEQRQNWIDEVERINRRISYIRFELYFNFYFYYISCSSRPVDDFLNEHSNYDIVDWSKISARDVRIFTFLINIFFSLRACVLFHNFAKNGVTKCVHC